MGCNSSRELSLVSCSLTRVVFYLYSIRSFRRHFFKRAAALFFSLEIKRLCPYDRDGQFCCQHQGDDEEGQKLSLDILSPAAANLTDPPQPATTMIQ